MKEIDLRDLFDDCYDGYKDYTGEIELHYNSGNRHWENDRVSIWKDETLSWCYRTAEGEYRYGYDSLRSAVRSCAALRPGESELEQFCASRLQGEEYHHDIRTGTIQCKVTWRHFIGPEDHTRFQEKCDALSIGFNMMLQ